MSKTSPILLILGAGSNIGRSVARVFAAKGYRIALAARTLQAEDDTEDQIHISSDFSDPQSVIDVFSKVRSSFAQSPSIVVYNAAVAANNDPKDPFSLPLTDFTKGLNVNTISLFVAAQQAVVGFQQLPKSASKTFIYTGNLLNTMTMAPLMTLGVGKSASAHIIQSAAAAYKESGYKFYYGDERKADGSAIFGVHGDAHGEMYLELAESETQGPWQQTFVMGKGYTSFPAA